MIQFAIPSPAAHISAGCMLFVWYFFHWLDVNCTSKDVNCGLCSKLDGDMNERRNNDFPLNYTCLRRASSQRRERHSIEAYLFTAIKPLLLLGLLQLEFTSSFFGLCVVYSLIASSLKCWFERVKLLTEYEESRVSENASLELLLLSSLELLASSVYEDMLSPMSNILRALIPQSLMMGLYMRHLYINIELGDDCKQYMYYYFGIFILPLISLNTKSGYNGAMWVKIQGAMTEVSKTDGCGSGIWYQSKATPRSGCFYGEKGRPFVQHLIDTEMNHRRYPKNERLAGMKQWLAGDFMRESEEVCDLRIQIQAFVSFLMNDVALNIIKMTLPLFLSLSSSGLEFMMNSMAVLFVTQLDDLPDAKTFYFLPYDEIKYMFDAMREEFKLIYASKEEIAKWRREEVGSQEEENREEAERKLAARKATGDSADRLLGDYAHPANGGTE